MRRAIPVAVFFMASTIALARPEIASPKPGSEAQQSAAILLDARGATYTPLGKGYINLRNGKYRAPINPDQLLDARTGRVPQVEEPKRTETEALHQ